jgi:hypothetical protein
VALMGDGVMPDTETWLRAENERLHREIERLRRAIAVYRVRSHLADPSAHLRTLRRACACR